MALLLDPFLRQRQIRAHRVEGGAEIAQLAWTGRLDAPFQVAAGQSLGGVHQGIQGAAHRADQGGDQCHRRDQSEHAGSDYEGDRAP